MKKPSDSSKSSLLKQLKAGIKRLLGSGESGSGSGGSAAPRRRTRKDLFPDEPKTGGSGDDRRPARSHSASPPRPEGSQPSRPSSRKRDDRRRSEGGRSGHSRTEGSRTEGSRTEGSRSEGTRTEGTRGERPRSESVRGESSSRSPRSGSSQGGRRGGERRERGRRERSPRSDDAPESRAPLPPAGPPPPPPPEPEGPFPEAFTALGLSPRVLGSVRDMGYETPTTIQEKSIPLILAGRDLIGASQTGTGKTAAFGLPILTRLEAPAGHPRVLILEPTRELALQVVEHFENLGRYTGLRTLAIYGGVGYDKQRRGLHTGTDVYVATPGRLLDFMGEKAIRLDTIEILVLDEVDRMLDMGFLPDVRKIVEKCPANRQTLFFSATMPSQIKTLANWALRDPTEVEVGIRFSPAETVSHYFYPVAGDQREALLMELLEQTHYHSVMIFTRTKVQADKLFAAIKTKGYPVAVMHSDIAQRDREEALKGFREGTFEVIVATDLAARGLDISNVTHVINYQVPENPEDYVHRIGRTGRARKEGDAFTLLAADELPFAEAIERLIGQTIERRRLPGFDYHYTTLLDPDAGSAEKFKKRFRGPGGPKRRRRPT